MVSDKYILVDRTPVPVDDVMEWARWFGTANRRVAQDVLGNVRVSTIFLGLDHGTGEPRLFETMIFGGAHDHYQDWCSTWEQAEKMHADAVTLVTASSVSLPRRLLRRVIGLD